MTVAVVLCRIQECCCKTSFSLLTSSSRSLSLSLSRSVRHPSSSCRADELRCDAILSRWLSAALECHCVSQFQSRHSTQAIRRHGKSCIRPPIGRRYSSSLSFPLPPALIARVEGREEEGQGESGQRGKGGEDRKEEHGQRKGREEVTGAGRRGQEGSGFGEGGGGCSKK